MKKQRNGFIPGFVTALLLVGLIGGAAATMGKQTIEVDYKNIPVMLDGEWLDLKDAKGNVVEPFAYNGTIFLPVRSISEALGCDVEWAFDSYVSIKSAPIIASPFYDGTDIPRFDFIIGAKSLEYHGLLDSGNTAYSYNLALSENGDYEALVKSYADMLKTAGYTQSSTGTVDGDKYFVFESATSKIEVTVAKVTWDDGGASVTVYFKLSNSASTTTGTTSPNSSSGNSASPGGNSGNTTDNSTAYAAELAALDKQYASDKAAIEEAARQENVDYRLSEKNFPQMQAAGMHSTVQQIQNDHQRAVNDFQNQLDSIKSNYDSAVDALKAKYGM